MRKRLGTNQTVIEDALQNILNFERWRRGSWKEFQLQLAYSSMTEALALDPERVQAIRPFETAISNWKCRWKSFEQLIYYLEKLDITEEKYVWQITWIISWKPSTERNNGRNLVSYRKLGRENQYDGF
jgi:hypothetical protein